MPAKKSFETELNKMIKDRISAEPLELYGAKWAVFDDLGDVANTLNVARKTLYRRTDKPPYRKRCKQIGGDKKKRTLLRILVEGEPEMTPEEIEHDRKAAEVQVMRNLYHKHTMDHKWPTMDQGKLLYHFSGEIGDNGFFTAPQLFEFTLKNWPFVASAIKLEVRADPNGQVRYLDYPSIGHIRRFSYAVVHAFVAHLQMTNKIPKGKENLYTAILQATESIPEQDYPYSLEQIEELAANGFARLAKKAQEKAAAKSAKKQAQKDSVEWDVKAVKLFKSDGDND